MEANKPKLKACRKEVKARDWPATTAGSTSADCMDKT